MPRIYRPVAVFWLGFSDLLGAVMSKILLSIVYFAVVTPIGILRRLAGKDSLKLRAFKARQGVSDVDEEPRFCRPGHRKTLLGEGIEYGIFKRYVGFPESKEEILAAARHFDSSGIRHDRGIGCGSAIAPFIYTLF